MPKADRPNREESRHVLDLLRSGRTDPDLWTREERAAVTVAHTWAYGAPPSAEIRAGDRPAPLPSKLLGGASFILPAEVLDHLSLLTALPEEVRPINGAPILAVESDGQYDDLRSERDDARAVRADLEARLDRAEADFRRVVDERNEARRQLVEHARDAEQNAEGLRVQVVRLEERLAAQQRTTVDLRGHLDGERARAEAAEEQADALRGEVARLSSFLDDAMREAGRADTAEERLASMTGKRNRARDHAVRNDTERDECREELDTLRRKLDRAGVTESMLVEGQQHGWLIVSSNLTPTPEDPASLRVFGPGLVEFDGRELRVTYDPAAAAEAILAGHDDANPNPVEDDPRRPHLDSYPEDAILLTYPEVRRLLGLHLEQCGTTDAARAMRDGETPLRLAEVLDR